MGVKLLLMAGFCALRPFKPGWASLLNKHNFDTNRRTVFMKLLSWTTSGI